MTPDKLLVIVISVIVMGFTYWFFLMKREKEVAVVGDSIDITVDGGYQPDFVSIPKGKTTKISFVRRDPSTCLEEVIISEFRIRKYLPLNKKVTIEVTPQKEGEFPFSCAMNMFHGKLKVISND